MVLAKAGLGLLVLATGYGLVIAGDAGCVVSTFEMDSAPCSFRIDFNELRLPSAAGHSDVLFTSRLQRLNVGLFAWDTEPFVVTPDQHSIELGYDLSVFVNPKKPSAAVASLLSMQEPSGYALLRFLVLDAVSDEVLIRNIKGSDIRLRGAIARRDTLETRTIRVSLADYVGRSVKLRAEICCTSLADKLPAIRTAVNTRSTKPALH